jgi:hypothetical protein
MLSNSTDGSDRATVIEPKEEATEMAPLFLFLASSFNVELVYVILKGITQFSYVIAENQQKSNEKMKRKFKKMELSMTDGNLTLVLKQIKIKDFDKWSSMKTDEDVQDVVKDLTGDIKA